MHDQNRIRNFSIIAHIDHGKTTLSDRLLELTGTISMRERRDQLLDGMELEREKGITIKAKAVRMEYTARDGQTYELNLIDCPGHVDFTYEVSRALAACEGAILVVDAAQGIEAQTLANVYLALEHDLTIVPVLNKIDLPGAEPIHVAEEIENVLGLPAEDVLLASAKEGLGVPEILEAIVERIPPPRGQHDQPLRALIFDSHYDAYKGVIAYVRVMDGALMNGARILLMGTQVEADLLEVGAFRLAPVIAWAMYPFTKVPWELWVAGYLALSLGAVALLGRKWNLVLLFAFPPVLLELLNGNIHLFMALAIWAGMRWPAAWSFILLTKVTPGVGVLWFAFRREWRNLAIALGVTAVIAAVSFVYRPDLWRAWLDLLVAATGAPDWKSFIVPVPVWFRLPIAVAILFWGARTDRRWTVPLASCIALPVLWGNGFAMLVAIIPLLAVASARSPAAAWLRRGPAPQLTAAATT